MGLLETYNYFMTEVADKRTNHWPFVGSPVPLLLLTFAYLYFVLRCGPRYMSDKRPYTLQTYIKFYNLFQVFANFLIVYHIIDAGFFTEIGIGCYPYKYSYEPNDYKMAHITWWILCLKILDFSETCVFVLRKKYGQISFLHLYHHVSTVWLNWLVIKYLAGGMSMTTFLINCSVHVIMYSYYFLTSFGASVQRYTNLIKPYITIVQMIQFVFLMLYYLQGFRPGCRLSASGRFMFRLTIAILAMNFMLFYQFYRKSSASKKTI